MFKIYTLADPRDGRIRYVGITSKSLRQRLAWHIGETSKKANQSHRVRWIRILRAAGLSPSIALFREVGAEEKWQDAEKAAIAECRANGCDLVNGTDGGDGVPGRKWRPTPEQAAKGAAARVGSKRSEAAKRKTSESLKALYQTDPQKAAERREYAARAARSENGRKAAADRMRARWADPVWRAKAVAEISARRRASRKTPA